MDTAIRDIMVEASRASEEGNQSFGEIVKQLADAGVERYPTTQQQRCNQLPNKSRTTQRRQSQLKHPWSPIFSFLFSYGRQAESSERRH